MAPEQLEGKDADERTDIFALGEVLYEMSTGQRTFNGNSKAQLIAAILSSEPPLISQIQPMSPPALDHVVKRCLAKEPDDRWQDAGDVAGQLKWISELGSQAHTAAPVIKKKKRERLATILAIFFFFSTVALIALLLNLHKNASSHQPVFSFSVKAPDDYMLDASSFDASNIVEMAVSPDGTHLAFIATNSAGKSTLCMRSLDTALSTPLSDTEGAHYPFWSPDGRFLGFFADAKLKRINVQDGNVETICDAPLGRGGTWSPEGIILFAPNIIGGIYRVNAEGGKASLLLEDRSNKGMSYRWPQFLPDHRHFLYVLLPQNSQSPTSIFLGSVDSKDSGLLVKNASNGFAVMPGYLAFVRNGKLMAESFDFEKLRPVGDAFQIVPEAVMHNIARGFAAFSLSANGILSFQHDSVRPSPLTWLDRTGKEIGRNGEAAFYESPMISPDGKQIAVTRNGIHIELGDISLIDIDRNTMSRFTVQPDFNYSLAWSPDGNQIFYSIYDLYSKPSNGASAEELLLHSDFTKVIQDVSPDGRFAMYRLEAKTKDLWILPLFGDRKPFLILQSVFNARFSPDGSWIVYESGESGQGEIYVRPFPGVKNGKWQVSTSGGRNPRWRRDGKEILYVSPDQELMAADVNTDAGFHSGLPKPLFRVPLNTLTNDLVYDTSTDGQRFVVSSDPAEKYSATITVLINWLDEVKRYRTGTSVSSALTVAE